MLPGVALEIRPEADGSLRLCKHAPSCHLCGSAEEVTTHKGLTLCRECAASFSREVD